jgi:hypothetical protein
VKTVICGGRQYNLSVDGLFHLDLVRLYLPITELVCGYAHGIDTSARRWAVFNGLPIADFPADWKKWGKAAGYIRNGEMAEYAEAVIAFSGGRGTDNMVEQGKAKGLHIIDLRDRKEFIRLIGGKRDAKV